MDLNATSANGRQKVFIVLKKNFVVLIVEAKTLSLKNYINDL